MKRLLILVDSLDAGSVSRRVCDLAEYWAALPEYEIHVAVITPVFNLAPSAAVRVHVLGTSRREPISLNPELFRIRNRFVELVRVLKPDCVLGMTALTNAFGAYGRTKLGKFPRFVVAANDISKGGYTLPLRLLLSASEKKVLRSADAVIVSSSKTALSLQTKVENNKLFLITNTINVLQVRQLSRALTPLPHPWLEFCTRPLVVLAGPLVPLAVLTEFLAAFHPLISDKGARLVILGQEAPDSAVNREIKRLHLEDSVVAINFLQNPYPTIKRANIFVYLGPWYCVPHTALEALAVGRPAVAVVTSGFDYPSNLGCVDTVELAASAQVTLAIERGLSTNSAYADSVTGLNLLASKYDIQDTALELDSILFSS